VNSDSPPDAVVRALVTNHRRFLDFLERRTRNRADAEDVLQSAFVRAIERGGSLRVGESAVAWFYRLLRNALIDRYRAEERRGRAHEGLAAGGTKSEVEDVELHAEVCRCVLDLLPTLKPEYADLLRRVELEGEAVHAAAQVIGITPNHAGVRLHRARKALLREVQRSCRTCASHGCLDCSCDRSGAGPE